MCTWCEHDLRQLGLTERLAAAVHDPRQPSSSDPPLRELFAPRLDPIASGSADGNEAHRLRHDPMGTLGVERLPVEAPQDWASAPTFSRLAHQGDRTARSRLPPAFVDHFLASDTAPPAAIVLDLDHADDRPHGPPACAFSHHHDTRDGERPLLLFEGTSPAWVTASRRPGARPTGAEQAMMLARLLPSGRQRWPYPHVLVRGDSPVAPPEVMDGIAPRRLTAWVLG